MFNKVILIGRLGKNAEAKTAQNTLAVTQKRPLMISSKPATLRG
jgi:single-stranded DNA-binding protein